jgi:hypothetical protein
MTLPDTPRIDFEVIASFAEMATSFANQLRLSVIDLGGSSFWFAPSWNRTFVNGIVFVARSKSPTRAHTKRIEVLAEANRARAWRPGLHTP